MPQASGHGQGGGSASGPGVAQVCGARVCQEVNLTPLVAPLFPSLPIALPAIIALGSTDSERASRPGRGNSSWSGRLAACSAA